MSTAEERLGLELFSLAPPPVALSSSSSSPSSELLEVIPARGGRGALLLAPAAALVPAALARRGVALVVQCAKECAPEEAADAPCAATGGAGAGAAAAAGAAPPVLALRLRDMTSQPLDAALARALPRIEAARAAGGAVVVACRAGRSRSVAVAAAHLMAGAERLSLRDALRALRRAQPLSLPNFGFCVQLLRLEARLRGAGGTSVPPGAVAFHALVALSFFDPDRPDKARAEATAHAAREVAAGAEEAAREAAEAAAAAGGGGGARAAARLAAAAGGAKGGVEMRAAGMPSGGARRR
jgi:hypothetical protein